MSATKTAKKMTTDGEAPTERRGWLAAKNTLNLALNLALNLGLETCSAPL